MTKKDFIALADTIREANNNTPNGNPEAFGEYAIDRLADFCQSQNPLFNRQLWLDYIAGKCGPGGKAK